MPQAGLTKLSFRLSPQSETADPARMVLQAANSIEMFARQNCASLLLAKSTALDKPQPLSSRNRLWPIDPLFKCKDCDRQFTSFQGLGGHRANHMKLRLPNQDNAAAVTIAIPGDGGQRFARPARVRVHECKECRERFPTGQALGGHMRKHAEFTAKRKRTDVEAEKALEPDSKEIAWAVSSESKKITRVVFDLDLNFPPPGHESSVVG